MIVIFYFVLQCNSFVRTELNSSVTKISQYVNILQLLSIIMEHFSTYSYCDLEINRFLRVSMISGTYERTHVIMIKNKCKVRILFLLLSWQVL